MSRRKRWLIGTVLSLGLLLALQRSGVTAVLLGSVSPREPTILAPASASQFSQKDLAPVTFAWTPVPGVAQYFFEFTGANRQFANPNGTAPDPVNGFGGAGGGFPVAGTSFQTVVPPAFPAGTYQVRVIGLGWMGRPKGTFSDAVTLILGTMPSPPGVNQPTLTAPATDSPPLRQGAPVTFAWTALPGVTQYLFEFTGANRQFANPNGTAPDPVNGFGGAGGGLPVAATGFSIVPGPAFPPGRYQVRVIGLSATGQLVGSFSDAVTVIVQ